MKFSRCLKSFIFDLWNTTSFSSLLVLFFLIYLFDQEPQSSLRNWDLKSPTNLLVSHVDIWYKCSKRLLWSIRCGFQSAVWFCFAKQHYSCWRDGCVIRVVVPKFNLYWKYWCDVLFQSSPGDSGWLVHLESLGKQAVLQLGAGEIFEVWIASGTSNFNGSSSILLIFDQMLHATTAYHNYTPQLHVTTIRHNYTP